MRTTHDPPSHPLRTIVHVTTPTPILECALHPEVTLAWSTDERAGIDFGYCRKCRDTIGHRPAADTAARVQATRDRVAARKTEAPLPPRFSSSVVGVSFLPTYPDILYRIEWVWAERRLFTEAIPDGDGMPGEGVPAVLIRNPDNEHDPNAIQVHVPAIVDDTWENAMIGHLPANIARRLAPRMDAGVGTRVWVHGLRIHTNHPDRPGIDVHVMRVD